MRKGWTIFIGILVTAALFCWFVPFYLLPKLGTAMALPVISVAPEKVCTSCLGIGGLTLTNTMIGTLIADLTVLLFAFGATRTMRTIPGRLQGLFEVLTDLLYGLAKSTAGVHARKILPVMGTLFLFVLVVNWYELVPGVDSVGLMHCAEDGMNGYPSNGVLLQVEKGLDSGTKATEADYEACHNSGHVAAAEEGAPVETATEGETPAGGETTVLAANDNLHIVTPFVRAASTDLNLTLGLALIAVITIQVFGVSALGGSYFFKFFNIPALDQADKEPMGVMDFAVGLLEIVSEISRIISFGFRLFGNIFAGMVLIFVLPFLAGSLMLFPIYGFELFVGVIQAFVFGMLFLVFSAMAMQGHGHDEAHE